LVILTNHVPACGVVTKLFNSFYHKFLFKSHWTSDQSFRCCL